MAVITRRDYHPGERARKPVATMAKHALDVSVLVGILMYGLFAVAIHALVEWLDRKLTFTSPSRPPGTVDHGQTA